MHKYCRAYHLKDLRQFQGWQENLEEGESSLSDDAIVFVWDDLTVVQNPVLSDKGVLWNTITPQWEQFCRSTLHFEIPEDLRYAYERDEEQNPAQVPENVAEPIPQEA